MAVTTVAQFAAQLNRATTALLEQLHSAGVAKRSPEDALTEAVVGPGGAGQVEGEVRQRCVLGGECAGDDAEYAKVGGKVVVGLLEQLEGEVELGLGDPLAKIEVDPIGHEDVASMRGKARCSWGGDAE